MTSARFFLFTSALASFAMAQGAGPEISTPDIVFSGVLTAEGKTHVALTDPASNSTRWVQLGNEFGDYSVVRYDPKEDAVFLKKGSQEIRVPLALPKTAEPSSATASTAQTDLPNAAEIATRVRTNLRQLAAAAQQYRQGNNVKTVSFNDLVGPGKIIPQLTPVAGENYSTLNFGPDVTAVSVTTADGATIALELRPTTPPAGAVARVEINPADPSAATPAPTGPTSTGALTKTSVPPAAETPATTGGQPAAVAGRPAPTTTPPAASAPTTPGPAAPGPDLSPTPTGRQAPSPSYTIQGGDTLQSIAAANGVTVQQLQELNPTLHGSSLQAGETIRIR